MKRRNRDINPQSSIPTSSPAVTRTDSRSNRADSPKTSEYAFFKKLKTDAGQRFDSHSMQREKYQPNMLNSSKCRSGVEGAKILGNISKSSEGTDYTRICSNDFRSLFSVENVCSKELGSLWSVGNISCEDSRLALPINKVTQINFDSFNSPVDRVANNLEVNLKKDFSAFENICSTEYWLEHDSNTKRPGGFQSDQVGLFSGKRQKLHQWAHNSFPEIDELCSKGYDLISMLLSRLLPWDHEKNSFRRTESTLVERNTKSELLACPNSGIPSEKLYRMPKQNIMEVEYVPCLDNGMSSYWPGRSRDSMLSNICSPTYNSHRTLQNNLELPSCEPRQKNLISCIERDSTFGFSFVRHGSFPPFSPSKCPDDFHDANRSLAGREPQLLLLEWDSVNMNERSLSATCQNTNWTTFPAVRNSWDPPQTPNNYFEAFSTLGLCPLPVLENYPQDFYSLIPPNGTIYDEPEFGRYILEEEEEEEMVADVSYLPLTLSHSSKSLNLMEDCNQYEVTREDSEPNDIRPSPGNYLGLIGEEISSPGTHISFALDVGWKCLQPSGLRRDRYLSTCNDLQFPEKGIIHSNILCEDGLGSSLRGSSYRNLIHYTEDILDIHDWRSFYSQLSRDKNKAYPLLLLDKSSWEDRSEEADA